MPIGFMNYTRRPGSKVTTRGGYRKRYRVRFARGNPVGKVVGTSYKRIANVVKAVVRRDEETKMLGLPVEVGVIHNAQMTNADIQPLLAGSTQGTGSTQRIGDKVRPVALKVRGCVSFYDRGQGNILAPMIVKIFCLQWKGLKDGSSGFGSVPMNTLMDGGAGVAGWDGSTLRGLWNINKDAFQVLATKTIKISDTDVENHKAQTGHYELSIPCPARLTYNTGSLYPSNFAPFFVLGWYYEDGSVPAITDVNIINTANSILYYKDA